MIFRLITCSILLIVLIQPAWSMIDGLYCGLNNCYDGELLLIKHFQSKVIFSLVFCHFTVCYSNPSRILYNICVNAFQYWVLQGTPQKGKQPPNIVSWLEKHILICSRLMKKRKRLQRSSERLLLRESPHPPHAATFFYEQSEHF